MTLGAWRTCARSLALTSLLGIATTALAQGDTTRTRVPVRKEQPSATAPAAKTQAAPTPAPTTPTLPTAKTPPEQPPVPAVRSDTTRAAATGEVVTAPAAPPAVSVPTCSMMPNVTGAPGRRMRGETCGMMPAAGATPAGTPQAPERSRTRYLFGASGFYLGASAGTAVPYNQLSDLGYDSGFNLTIPVGWHRPGRTLGLRATLAFDQVHADQARIDVTAPAMLGSAPDPKIYSGALDAVLQFPIGRDAREGRGLTLYTLGGGGVYLFRGFGGTTPLADVLGGDEVGNSRKNIHKWGLQAGAGMQYGLGPAAVFVESRWVNVFTSGSRTNTDYLRWVPVSVGVMLR